MDNIIRYVSKSELERERLIREARAIYDSIFPPVAVAIGRAGGDPGRETQALGHTSTPKPAVNND
ncbi:MULTISPECIES: hypothetical protein [unclassified Bradyrhizobium]|uniref:hypothetical protein n=1 Tax=unclassified Bradyrhizobium TaxID=2631580 RepID=UPI001FF8CF13|nr:MULTISPECIES: hypothetical protein [unclassified Bradyrhizobium]MCK1713080.1 hypothetical protein [Bradyrhizobium sp. 143]MCK1730502.1 hypothetical protein [Bradyrhizobium sp. 142]